MALTNPTGVVTERRLSDFYQGILPYLNGNNSGGHEILGDGTAVAQENKLDFVGVSVTDDSTNEKTVVQGIGLNQDSLDDIAGAGLPATFAVGSGFNYSTSEQVVGRWIDGKPIYQKTLTGTTATSGDEAIAHNIANVDICVGIEGYCIQQGYAVPIGFYNGSAFFSAFMKSTTLDLRYYATGYKNCPYRITVRYTKTTD